MNAQEPGTSPPSPDETGGAPESHKGLVTVRDVTMVVIAVGLAFGVAAYLDTPLNQIETAVHDNSRGLAVVQTEITALRRDIERVEDLSENTDRNAEMRPTSRSRSFRSKQSRPPI